MEFVMLSFELTDLSINLERSELIVLSLGLLTLLFLFISKRRIRRSEKKDDENTDEVWESMYKPKDVLMQDSPGYDKDLDHVPAINIHKVKNDKRRLIYLLFIVIVVIIIVGIGLSESQL